MKFLMKLTISTLALCSPFAAANWQAGTFVGAEYDENTEETLPIVLPWLAYESRHWQLNPLNILYKKPTDAANWRVGLALDHSAWEDDWREAFAATAGTEMFIGPVRFDNSAQITVAALSHWKTRHTLGTLLPLAPNLLIGVETGLALHQSEELSTVQTTWTSGVQLMSSYNNWRFLALGSWDKNLTEATDKRSGMLSVVYEW